MGLEPAVTFNVHESLICAASKFVKRAVSDEWNASTERSVKLQEEDPEIFQIYVHWLYRHALPVRIDRPGIDGNAEYLRLAKAYVLGDMLLDGSFQDAALDAILEKTHSKANDGRRWYPVGPVIEVIYDNTVESSKARALLVDLYTYHAHGTWLVDHAKYEQLPKQFLYDLAVSILNIRSQPTPPSQLLERSCAYHQHGAESKSCYRLALLPNSGDS